MMADKTEKPEKRSRRPRRSRPPSRPGRESQARRQGAPAEQEKAAEDAKAAAAAPLQPEPKIPARMRLRFEAEIVPALMRELKIENKMRVPRLEKIMINMALRRSARQRQAARSGGRRVDRNRRAEADDDQRAQGDFEFQAARERADRRDGDAAARADVGIFRSPGECRAAAGARLPRHQREGIRRARQLLARAARAYDFRRTESRQDREGQGT